MDPDPLAKLRADLQANPDDPQVHVRLAEYLYEQGSFEHAATSAQRALQLGHDSAEVRLLLGKALMDQGCPAEAGFQFAQLLERYPGHAEAMACQESIRRITAAIDVVRASNPRELQLEVRNHIIVLHLAGMMAPFTEDGDRREPLDRLSMVLARLLQLGQIGCIVDLTRVRFVSSFFLGKLLEWRRKLIGEEHGMAICGANPEIRDLLNSTRVSRLIPVVETVDQAVIVVQQAAARGGLQAE